MRGALFFGTPRRSIGNDLTEFHNINAPPSLINACASICSDLQRVELIQVRFVARAAGESVSCVFVSGTIPVLVRPVITRDHLPLQPHDKRKKFPFQLWPLIYIVSRILHLTCCALGRTAFQGTTVWLRGDILHQSLADGIPGIPCSTSLLVL